MHLFQSILADIKKKLDLETGHIDVVARVASDVLHMTVTPSMIVHKGSHITLKLPVTARVALTMKRQALLLALQNEGVKVNTIS